MKLIGEHIVISKNAIAYLENFLSSQEYTKVFVLVDENTRKHCLPELKYPFDTIIEIESGELNKNLDSATAIWESMLALGADRHSALVNLGGGVIGDMGGFCAATYMRGIDFIQVPTTLLAMVDASVGGKLGIDLQHAKNIIGLFEEPAMNFIHLPFLDTLEKRQFMSGYAEMLKHGLILDHKIWEELRELDERRLLLQVEKSIILKRSVAEEDPLEEGLRKVLNFGHTIGHGLESYALANNMDVLHGEAVAAGMIIESILSAKSGLNLESLQEIKSVLYGYYGSLPFQGEQAEAIWQFVLKDKKNKRAQINCTLLKSIGTAVINRPISFDEFEEAFNNYLKGV